MVGLECKLCCDVAVNHTLVLPWAVIICSSLENISKLIISQNPENLDPVEGMCMYCLTDWFSGFACGDHADCVSVSFKLVVSVSLHCSKTLLA